MGNVICGEWSTRVEKVKNLRQKQRRGKLKAKKKDKCTRKGKGQDINESSTRKGQICCPFKSFVFFFASLDGKVGFDYTSHMILRYF